MILIPGGGEAKLADGLAEGGDHVLLGKSIGLDAQAAKIGARTLMAEDAWKEAVSGAIANPNTRISVSLDGVNGGSAYGKVMGAAQRGASGAGTPFDWEMGQLYSNGALGDVTFYEGGKIVANPFG
jgi:hypothetical protein